MRNVHMIQMSHAGVQMQSLSMMVSTHIFKPWCQCLLLGMSWCKCFDANTIYSKIPFVFKIKAFSAPETKIFSNLDLLFPEKSSSFFWLKLMITVRNVQIEHWLEIWWSGSRDLFSQFDWARRWHVSKAFFLKKKWILWKSSILKRFIFF